MILPETKLDIECVTVLGTIEVDVSELEEESIDVPFLSFSCGETESMTMTAVGFGKKCEVSSTTVQNAGSKRKFTAKVTCPNNLLPEGTELKPIPLQSLTYCCRNDHCHYRVSHWWFHFSDCNWWRDVQIFQRQTTS